MGFPWLKNAWNHRLMLEGVPPSTTEKSNMALETQTPKTGKTQIFQEEISLSERE